MGGIQNSQEFDMSRPSSKNKDTTKNTFDDKKSYRIELKREKKGISMQEEVVQLATSGLELTLSGLGPQ